MVFHLLSVVVHIFSPSTWETEANGSVCVTVSLA